MCHKINRCHWWRPRARFWYCTQLDQGYREHPTTNHRLLHLGERSTSHEIHKALSPQQMVGHQSQDLADCWAHPRRPEQRVRGCSPKDAGVRSRGLHWETWLSQVWMAAWQEQVRAGSNNANLYRAAPSGETLATTSRKISLCSVMLPWIQVARICTWHSMTNHYARICNCCTEHLHTDPRLISDLWLFLAYLKVILDPGFLQINIWPVWKLWLLYQLIWPSDLRGQPKSWMISSPTWWLWNDTAAMQPKLSFGFAQHVGVSKQGFNWKVTEHHTLSRIQHTYHIVHRLHWVENQVHFVQCLGPGQVQVGGTEPNAGRMHHRYYPAFLSPAIELGPTPPNARRAISGWFGVYIQNGQPGTA